MMRNNNDLRKDLRLLQVGVEQSSMCGMEGCFAGGCTAVLDPDPAVLQGDGPSLFSSPLQFHIS